MAIYSDTPAETDLLNRKPFADQIGKRIVTGFSNEHECVVLGLNGAWGSGKSTLLKFLKESIVENCRTEKIESLIYDFNPWMFSGQENLQREFLEGLLHLLKDRFKKSKDWQKWADKRLDYLRFIKWIPKYGEDTFQTFEKVVKGLDAFGSVRDLKQKVDEILVNEKTRLFIFLDDLDRLSPDETAEIFQLVKLNTNFKNSVFVVAYDREVVDNALSHRYGGSSKRYLEKIVQVDYKVPEILPEKRREVLIKGLEELFKSESIEYDVSNKIKDAWRACELDVYFKSLRDIYRYLNAIHFRLPTIYEEVDITDFLLVETIRIFDNDGYEALYNERRVTRQQQLIGPYIVTQPTGFSQSTQRIVNHLIPSNAVSSDFDKGKKRFADHAFTNRYFALQISSFDVSEQEFEEFLVGKNKVGLLKSIATGGRLGNFFDKISNAKQEKGQPLFDYEQILNAIFELLEDDVLQRKWWQYADRAIKSMKAISSTPIEVDRALLNCLLRDQSGLSYSRYLFTFRVLQDLKKEEQNAKNAESKSFYKKSALRLEVRWQKYHEDWFFHMLSPDRWKNPPFIASLYLSSLSEIMPLEFIEGMKKLIEDDTALLEISKSFAMFLDHNGRPARYDGGMFNKILPPPLDQVYFKRLPEILAILPDGQDREIVSFMIEALEPTLSTKTKDSAV